MVILKCKMCGGDIELASDSTYGVCNSCGRSSTRPKMCTDQRANLFNRGNLLRMRGEFEKAAAVFEKIIELDATDAEAHWCLALCRYGIEYIEDPKSGERIPVCYRMSYDLLINDIDYQMAVENSDSFTADLYAAEAKKITETQKAIIVISQRAKPYDIFICHKETTADSAVAQHIYNQLADAGYRVFFSQTVLEGKPDTEREPYIFAALNSAKIMLVVGTSPDNLNDVWVRNEWSRFLSIMKKDSGRRLIPCYRDMNPADLPDEFLALRPIDLVNANFLQSIMQDVKSVLRGKASGVGDTKKTKALINQQKRYPIENLIESAEAHLEHKDYAAAYESYSRVVEVYPEDYRGWWGFVVCAIKGSEVLYMDKFHIDRWFQYVEQYADEDVFITLKNEYDKLNSQRDEKEQKKRQARREQKEIAVRKRDDAEKARMEKGIEMMKRRLETLVEKRRQTELKKANIAETGPELERQLEQIKREQADHREALVRKTRGIDTDITKAKRTRKILQASELCVCVMFMACILFGVSSYTFGSQAIALISGGAASLLAVLAGGMIDWESVLPSIAAQNRVTGVMFAKEMEGKSCLAEKSEYDRRMKEVEAEIKQNCLTKLDKEIEAINDEIARIEKNIAKYENIIERNPVA
ncbi:MAG: TIR domain-containing protein [Chitinispirillales bacterium]|jgi:tetratricopeptide (TPR) repeat protein|nr:TIR domain-containing protein [Chitinispirillales bacterium]